MHVIDFIIIIIIIIILIAWFFIFIFLFLHEVLVAMHICNALARLIFLVRVGKVVTFTPLESLDWSENFLKTICRFF